MAVLTVREAADRLGVGYSTLKQWIYKGSVRTSRTDGGHHRIAESEVDRLMARAGGPGPPRAARRQRAGGVLMVVSGRNRLRGVVVDVDVERDLVPVEILVQLLQRQRRVLETGWRAAHLATQVM